jgi:hypothetical protein
MTGDYLFNMTEGWDCWFLSPWIISQKKGCLFGKAAWLIVNQDEII